MGPHKKITILFVLLTIILFIGFEAEAGRPVYLSDYVGQGNQGDSWIYACETWSSAPDIEVKLISATMDSAGMEIKQYRYRYLINPDNQDHQGYSAEELPFFNCKIGGGNIEISQWPGCDSLQYPFELNDRQPTDKVIDLINPGGSVNQDYALYFDAILRGGSFSAGGMIFYEWLEVSVLNKHESGPSRKEPYGIERFFRIPLDLPPALDPELAPEVVFMTFELPNPNNTSWLEIYGFRDYIPAPSASTQ